jgi:transcriptional regulator with XRE-family HTH domain
MPNGDGLSCERHAPLADVSTDAEARLGEILRRARMHRGYTLREVQERTGIMNAHLSQIEQGRIRRPNSALLWRLAELYSLDYGLIASWSGYTPTQRSGEADLGAAIRMLQDLDDRELPEVMRFVDRLLRERGRGQS